MVQLPKGFPKQPAAHCPVTVAQAETNVADQPELPHAVPQTQSPPADQ